MSSIQPRSLWFSVFLESLPFGLRIWILDYCLWSSGLVYLFVWTYVALFWTACLTFICILHLLCAWVQILFPASLLEPNMTEQPDQNQQTETLYKLSNPSCSSWGSHSSLPCSQASAPGSQLLLLPTSHQPSASHHNSTRLASKQPETLGRPALLQCCGHLAARHDGAS